MSREIFIDTSGFYAILVQADQQHASAKAILDSAAKKRARFLTTDYVLDETATLLKARGFVHLANPFFNLIQSSDACRVLWTDQERFSVVQRFFIKHLDQAWSFTDCVSFCVMKERRLREALTKDEHFAAAGYVVLLK